MKSALITAACFGLAVYPIHAQMRNNTDKTMTCENGNFDGDRARHCDIREQSVPGVGRFTIDGGSNGGATIKGWLRNEVLVRSRVEASGDNQSVADSLASQVMIDTSGAQVHATGPESRNNSSWSVSYEIFVPQNMDLNLKGNNGGLTVSDVRGQIHFDVNNGGVHLKRVAGDVSGTTNNGGIQVELDGATWDGRQLELSTHNGGVTVAMPNNYSARFQTETNQGSISSDFPIAQRDNLRARKLEFALGAGGPLIHISTGNGGIKLKRADTE
jgi:hypothetical protein